MLDTPIMVTKNQSLKPAALRDIPLFYSFSYEQLQRITDTARVVSFKAHQVILKQDEPANAFYLILEGGVRVEREESSGAVYPLGQFGSGRICGELSLLRGEPSRVTVIAAQDAELLKLDREALLEVFQSADATQILNIFFALDDQMRAANELGFREILSRRMLAAQMEVEKQRALTQMVAGVAHEVNTPLGVINAAVIIMARELAAAPREVTAQRAAEIAESLELMRLNVERADRLLQDFKKISVSQLTDEKSEFDIVKALEETIGLISASLKRHQIRVNFHNQLTDEQKQWLGYSGLLSQVLINLLTNIERYAYPNGIGGMADVTLSLSGDGKKYLLSVRDYGNGVAEEIRAHVFKPFFTTGRAVGGSGLGLSIVYNIVTNALNGDIDLKSVEGKGAEFIVTFPRVIP